MIFNFLNHLSRVKNNRWYHFIEWNKRYNRKPDMEGHSIIEVLNYYNSQYFIDEAYACQSLSSYLRRSLLRRDDKIVIKTKCTKEKICRICEICVKQNCQSLPSYECDSSFLRMTNLIPINLCRATCEDLSFCFSESLCISKFS